MKTIFETDFSDNPLNVKMTGDVLNPFVGSEAAFIDAGVANKFLLQTGGEHNPFADIVPHIDDPTMSMLRLSGGRRVQSKLGGLFVREGWSEQRMYLNADHSLLFNGPLRAYMWQELKVSPNVVPTFRMPFRFLVGEDQLGWQVHAVTSSSDPNAQEFWSFDNWDVPVPIGEWFTVGVYYRAGNDKTGRIQVTMQRDGGSSQIIHDITRWTDSPLADEMRACQEWYPQKMYGTDSLFEHVAGRGALLEQYIDWWRFSVGDGSGSAPPLEPVPTPDPGPTPGGPMLTIEWDHVSSEYAVKWGGQEVARDATLKMAMKEWRAQLVEDNREALDKITQIDDAIEAL